MHSVQNIVVSLAFAASALAATQITDGQIQAPTTAPVTQITDGQIQAPTSVPVKQITDGQIQIPTSAPTPVKQISDGQIQQVSTGVPAPSPNGTFTHPGPSASAFTGAANILGWSQEMALAAVGAAAGFAML